jgi:hypothetical protein
LIALFGATVIAPVLSLPNTSDRIEAAAAEQGPLWIAAWFVPTLAAMSLVLFMTMLRAVIDREGRDPHLTMALAVTAVGAAIEGVACCAGSLLPLVARASPPMFEVTERFVRLGTTTFGNGPFSLGQLLATIALARIGAPRLIVLSGHAAAISGLGFMISGAVAGATLVGATNGLLFVALTIFSVSLARWTPNLSRG